MLRFHYQVLVWSPGVSSTVIAAGSAHELAVGAGAQTELWA